MEYTNAKTHHYGMSNTFLGLLYVLYPEDGGDVPPKRRFLQDPHGATSQKTAVIVTAVKTSNPTQRILYFTFA
jgi:hypothetical protein